MSKDTKRILTFLQLRPDFLVSICETFSNSIISNLTRGVSPIWFDATISLLRTFGTFELAFPPIHPIEEDKFVVYLDRISVALFQLTQSCIQSFLTVISTITPRNTNTSTSTITPSNSSNLEEMPDLVEGLFSLVEVCLKEHPAAFFGPLDPLTANPHLMPLFTLALQGLSLQERNSFKSVAQFFVTFINLQTAYRKPSLSTQSLDLKVIVNTIMTALLPDITQRLVSGIAWTLPRSSILFAADVLYSTIRTYPHEMQSLLKNAVGGVERLSLKEKELIVKQFLSTRILRNFKEHTKEFFIKSRGLDGTAFGSTF